MKKVKKVFFLIHFLFLSLSTMLNSQEREVSERQLDEELKMFISRFRYAPTRAPSKKSEHLYNLLTSHAVLRLLRLLKYQSPL